MKKIILFCLALSLSACGNGDIKDVVKAHLKDPDSAKFGQIDIIKGKDVQIAVVTVNAKNSYGGYVGEKQAMLGRGKGTGMKWDFHKFEDLSHEDCVKIAKEVVK